MAEKPTVMVLNVDLQCPNRYKKVKKILCKYPQIRDQVYDVKTNTVTVTVECCNPEKLRDKLCCKGCKVIKSIEIKEPKPDPTPTTTPPKSPVPRRTCHRPCYEGYSWGACYHWYRVPPPPQPCYYAYYGYGYGPCRGCHVCKCGYYFSHDDSQGCHIM